MSLSTNEMLLSPTDTMLRESEVARLRRDFPILATEMNGHPLAYLDNAATTQKPQVVLEAMLDFYTQYNANIHRGAYKLSEKATVAYEEAHEKVAKFIHAEGIENIVFTRNCTEAINLVAYSWARANVHSGDRILMTQMEHHSNLVPWQLLAKEKNVHLDFLPINEDGTLAIDQLPSLLTDRTKLVAVTQASNVLGTINPIREIARQAHEAGAKVLVDGAQGVPHFPIDVRELDCDFFAFSGHKMLGPTGIGVLYGKTEILEEMPPFLAGGDMISDVTFTSAEWNELPWKFEAGTPAIAEGIGLAAAIDYLNAVGMERIQQYEQFLLGQALERLQHVDGIKIFGQGKHKTAVVSFALSGVHPHDLATFLDHHGVAIRAGHHCAQPLMKLLGVPATARASFYFYNTIAEIDQFVNALRKAREYFKR